MRSIQRDIQALVIYIKRNQPGHTFDGSHLLKVSLGAGKGPRCQNHFQMSEKDLANMVYSSNV